MIFFSLHVNAALIHCVSVLEKEILKSAVKHQEPIVHIPCFLAIVDSTVDEGEIILHVHRQRRDYLAKALYIAIGSNPSGINWNGL